MLPAGFNTTFHLELSLLTLCIRDLIPHTPGAPQRSGAELSVALNSQPTFTLTSMVITPGRLEFPLKSPSMELDATT